MNYYENKDARHSGSLRTIALLGIAILVAVAASQSYAGGVATPIMQPGPIPTLPTKP